MSSRGQSLSMFVVQRTFTRVLRGYDPDEVDRHLELVSQWFTSTDAGRAFAHARKELAERERAVAAREAEQARGVTGARLEADATLEGAGRRAAAAIREAEERAAALVAEARGEAEKILDATRAEAAALAQRLRAEAEEDLRIYIDRRRREADRLAEAARRERHRS
jgi:DivIVA domain-containing protein